MATAGGLLDHGHLGVAFLSTPNDDSILPGGLPTHNHPNEALPSTLVIVKSDSIPSQIG